MKLENIDVGGLNDIVTMTQRARPRRGFASLSGAFFVIPVETG